MASSQRKLFLFGKYSLALLPPKKWLSEFNIKKGDLVELELDKSRKRIIIHLNATEAALTNSSTIATPIITRKNHRKPKGDDWQSIPEL